MGIKGLMTYMMSDGSPFKPYKLRKTRVIIDGNNLLYSIHDCHNVYWQFGGEYDNFDRALVKFFDRLKLCEIDPLVIFDGCYDPNGSKFNTVISRFKDRIVTSVKLNKKFSSEGYLLPMLAYETMVTVLQRLNIKHVTCQLEADREAAALSNYFNCPVISNDSDFFIFPLTCGFIPVGNLNFIPVEESCQCCPNSSHYFMSSTIFNQSNLRLRTLSSSPIIPDYMPLFATLMGNDFVNIDFYDKIFHLNTGSKSSKAIKNTNKFSNILNWLHQFDNLESAFSAVMLLIKEYNRSRVETLLKQSLTQYDVTNSSLVDSIRTNSFVFYDYGNESLSRLPTNVKMLLSQSIMKSTLIDSILSGNVILPTYVESIKDQSVHFISNKIRDRVYCFLLNSIDYQCQPIISEYIRNETNIFKRQIDVNDIARVNDPLSVEDDCIPSIINRDLFLNTMILYWTKFSDKTILNCRLALALIASVFIQSSWQNEMLRPDSDFIRQRHSHRIMKFFNDPIVSNVNKFQIKVVHSFNELQSVFFCLVQFYCLTGVFDANSLPPAPQILFCGRLCYNLAQDFNKRKDCWSYTRQLFDSFPCNVVKSKFLDVIQDVRNIWAEFDTFISNVTEPIVG